LTVLDEPKVELKVIIMVTRVCSARDHLTSCNWFKLVFLLSYNIFQNEGPAADRGKAMNNNGNKNKNEGCQTMMWG
jgi:hypothetical protein